MEIYLKNCDISIGNNLILQDVSVEIKEKSLIRITGENGAGKTVLMNTMLGIISTVKGERNIMFKKEEVCYINDNAFFFDDEKVSEILKIISWFYSTKIKDIVEALKNLGLNYNSIRNKKVYELSKGMKKKLMIVPMMFDNSKLLFLDEVFTGLDLQSQENILEVIKKKYNEQATIVFIEHNEEIAKRILDRELRIGVIECKEKTVLQM